MNSFDLKTDPKEDQYGRLVSAVMGTLRGAVKRRQAEGETRASIAAKIGCDRSQLSRVLNGNVGNVTIRTVSDILWATRHEPVDFHADAYEDISSNYLVEHDEPATITPTPKIVKIGGVSEVATAGSAKSFSICVPELV